MREFRHCLTMSESLNHDPIARLPSGLFGAALGLSGIAAAWSKIGDLEFVDPGIGFALGMVAALVFSVCSLALGAKAILRPAAALGDLRDPNRLAPYGAGAMSLMGIGALLAAKAPNLGTAIWQTGALFDGLICIFFCARLLAGRWSFNAAGPLWLVPAVGAIAAPASGIGLGQDLASGILFGQGIMGLTLVLPAIIVRMSFHDRPPTGAPLAILLTPPGLGCVSLIAMNGGVDHLAFGIYGAAVTIAGGLCFLGVRIAQAPPNINLWTLIFPMANFSIATLLVGSGSDTPVLVWFGIGLTILVSLMGIAILGWTGFILSRGGFTTQGLIFRGHIHQTGQ